MSSGTTDVIAPRALIIPNGTGAEQLVSGAMYISGARLYFFPYDGTARPYLLDNMNDGYSGNLVLSGGTMTISNGLITAFA